MSNNTRESRRIGRNQLILCFRNSPGCPGFYPTVNGTYDFYLAAYDDLGNEVARSDIQIIVGTGGAPVPEPATLSLLALGLAGLGVRFRARKIGCSLGL